MSFGDMVVGFAFDRYTAPEGEDWGAALLSAPGAEDRVLLIDKIRGPAGVRARLNGIGGQVRAEESASDAMVREFQEEAGPKTWPSDWCCFAEKRFEGGRVFFFVYTRYGLAGQVLTEGSSRTDEEVAWYSGDLVRASEREGRLASDCEWAIPLAHSLLRSCVSKCCRLVVEV